MVVDRPGDSIGATQHFHLPSTDEAESAMVESSHEALHTRSNLLSLPVELRLKILSELLQHRTPLCLTPIVEGGDPEDSDSRDEDVRWVPTWQLSAQVLAVCRQLNEEGSPILYGNDVCMHFCERSVTILDVHLSEEMMSSIFCDLDHDETVSKTVRRRNDSTEIAPCRCSSFGDHINNRVIALKRFKRLTCSLDGGAPPQNTKACLILRSAGAHEFDHITIKNNSANRTYQNKPTRWYSGPIWLKYLRSREVSFDGKHPDPPWANQVSKYLKSTNPSPDLLRLFLSMQDVLGNVLDESFDTLMEVLGRNHWKAAEGRELNYLYQADGQQYQDECMPALERAEAKAREQLAKVVYARKALEELYH